MNSKLKILVVDDHPLFRQGIAGTLKEFNYIHEIREAKDGNEALTISELMMPDIVLMDINMPVMNGIECTRILRVKHPKIKVIALTLYEDKFHIEAMMEAGVRGYLLKNITAHELDAAIKAVENDKMYFSPELVGKMLFRSAEFVKNDTLESADSIDLLKKEKEILKLIYEEYSNPEIASILLMSENTVRFYRKNLFSKTGNTTVIGLIKYAIRQGWI
jgi:DNA-binding NarL/FixJ family response regulator